MRVKERRIFLGPMTQKSVFRNKGLQGGRCRFVDCHHAVFLRLRFLEFERIAGGKVFNLAQGNRQKFIRAKGRIDPEDKKAEVARMFRQNLFDVLDRGFGADRLDFRGRPEDRMVRIFEVHRAPDVMLSFSGILIILSNVKIKDFLKGAKKAYNLLILKGELLGGLMLTFIQKLALGLEREILLRRKF